jgi:hypothetical protein
LRANQNLRAKLASALNARGIPADRIDSGRFSSTPRHGPFSDKVRSYRVENLLKVAVLDEKEFQDVARLLDEFSDIEYESVEFEHSKKEEMRRKALAQAIQNAAERKKVYEQELGLKLYPVRFMEDPVAFKPIYPQAAVGVGLQSGSAPTRAGIPPIPAVTEGPTGFTELVFSASVSVEYWPETKK